MKLSIAISPCPNDTFMFGPLALRLVKIPEIDPVFSYFDIEELNERAISEKHDILKISFATWLNVKEKYQLLRTGAALSEDCGPLLVARPHTPWPPKKDCISLLPGKHTTAHLLFRLWSSDKLKKQFVSYDQIMTRVIDKEADFGVIIHESRFLAEKRGLKIVCDLGKWWKNITNLPVPLGCLIASNSLPLHLIQLIEDKIFESISFARDHEDTIMEYIKKHAIELDEQVIIKHIKTFVNEQSAGIDERGWQAIARLEDMAAAKQSND